jgi:hypothetical protein
MKNSAKLKPSEWRLVDTQWAQRSQPQITNGIHNRPKTFGRKLPCVDVYVLTSTCFDFRQSSEYFTNIEGRRAMIALPVPQRVVVSCQNTMFNDAPSGVRGSPCKMSVDDVCDR